MILLKKAAAWMGGFFLSLILTVLIVRIPVMFVMDHVGRGVYLPMRLILLGLFALWPALMAASVIFLEGLIYEVASKPLLKYACVCALIPLVVTMLLGLTPANGYMMQSLVFWQDAPYRGLFFTLFLAPTVLTAFFAGRRRRAKAA